MKRRKAACLDRIIEVWTDLRHLGLRKKMEAGKSEEEKIRTVNLYKPGIMLQYAQIF